MSSFGTIDISLTSISSRMTTLHLTLMSLLDQSYSDIRINLYLSREPYLLDEGVDDVGEEIVALQKIAGERLRITYTRNTGPYRKLIPYLLENWGTSRLVVTVDDDTVYPKDWLQGLLYAYGRNGCSVAYRGHRIVTEGDGFAPYRSWMKSEILENPSPLILPTGKDGILYDTAFFPLNVLNMTDALRLAPTTDDLWFRWNLVMNGISVYIIKTDYTFSFEESDYQSSLYLNFNRGGSNDVAIKELDRYFRGNHGFNFSKRRIFA